MKKQSVFAVLSPLLALCLFAQTLPVQACSFATETYFNFTTHPDFPFRKYAAGNLGILDAGFARSYLVVAYRYLSGSPLSSKEQQGVLALWKARLTDTSEDGCTSDTSTWLNARKLIAGSSGLDSIETTRSINTDEAWQVYCNCQTPAFESAAATLKARIAKFGADSAAVKDWLKAQDQVFANCGTARYSDKELPPVIPAVLSNDSDPLLKQDRAYQIAAAHFYAQQFDDARKDFEAIAADSDSPRKPIAGYLAVRSMVRQATLAKERNNTLLTAAHEKLKQMLADSSYANMSADLLSLDSYVMARIAPEQHLNDLAAEVNRQITFENIAEFTKTLDLLLNDDGISETPDEYAKLPAAVKKTELTDWIMTFQTSDSASNQHALQKWKQTHSTPWLVAAVTAAAADDADAKAIVAAARAVPRSSPAYWSTFYHANRLEIDSGNANSVRKRLDAVLAAPPPDLSPGTKNELTTQRLTVAATLAEFVRFGIQVPVCVCSSGGTEQVPDDFETLEKTGTADKEAPLFTQEAGYILDKKTPLSVLGQLAKDPKIPTALRAHLAWTSWVRAVLIGDDGAARSIAVTTRPFNKAKTALIDAYLKAATPDERRFAATMLMLQFSSAQPDVGWGPLTDDDYGDSSGWWWSGNPQPDYRDDPEFGTARQDFQPLFLTAAQQARAAKEVAKLAGVPTAPTYFARNVLAWAKAHPADPRVPQALHLAVKATRYGAVEKSTDGLSKQMFQLLHTKYKGSPWTKKTPYYY